ncbi:hypothetical protein J6590_027307 [Homalodisca vitripennis]|nr:hypothetical protein J6590_027307 [Homalodisca vitripennis]
MQRAYTVPIEFTIHQVALYLRVKTEETGEPNVTSLTSRKPYIPLPPTTHNTDITEAISTYVKLLPTVLDMVRFERML